MSTANHVLRVATAYAAHKGLALSTVGRLAAGKGTFFELLSEGRVTIRRAERVLQWFSDNWPADLAWPADIPRPAPTVQSEPPSENPKPTNGLKNSSEPPPPGVLRVPDRLAVRRSMVLERGGMSGWARRRGLSPKRLQAVLSAYAGRDVKLNSVRSLHRRALIEELCEFVDDGAAKRLTSAAVRGSMGGEPRGAAG